MLKIIKDYEGFYGLTPHDSPSCDEEVCEVLNVSQKKYRRAAYGLGARFRFYRTDYGKRLVDTLFKDAESVEEFLKYLIHDGINEYLIDSNTVTILLKCAELLDTNLMKVKKLLNDGEIRLFNDENSLLQWINDDSEKDMLNQLYNLYIDSSMVGKTISSYLIDSDDRITEINGVYVFKYD